MKQRRESDRFPVSRFLETQKCKAGKAFIPTHLLHHVSRIYDFYFGADAPVNIDLDQDIIYQVKSDYFSKQVPVDWLDDAVFQVLLYLYDGFHGFLLKSKELTGKKSNLSNRASSLYSSLFKDYKQKRSSIYSMYVSDSSYTSASILDNYLENSSDLETTLSPDWDSEKDMGDVMNVEVINSRPARKVLSKTTRQLYLDSSGLCLLNATSL
jgi:hypothetical protein